MNTRLQKCRPAAERSFARRAGFTLVEILVALGIFSLVLAAIYSSWTAILRASKVGTEAAAAVQRARMAGRTIEESLTSVQSYAQNMRLYAFLSENGNESTLSFVSRLSPSFPRSGKFGDFSVRRVTFSVEQGRDGTRDLVLRQNPVLMDMDKEEKEVPLILAKNVKEFKTEFWDLRLQDWVDEWKQTNQIPVLVKVSLQLADTHFAHQVKEQITRIVSLPSVTVPPAYQVPRLQGIPPNQQIPPGQAPPGQGPPGQGQLPGQGYPGGTYPGQLPGGSKR
jgi:general secretion pathway protein J